MKLIRKKFWIATILLLATQARAGGISEGGTDYAPPWLGSAWFLEKGSIRTCVEVSPDFGYSKEAALQDIRSAFGVWDRYIREKGISRFVPNRYSEACDPRFFIVSEATLLPNCDGTQELTIYLGVTKPEVEAVKARYENPVAFAHRQSYDLELGRSKGFIWVAKTESVLPLEKVPDWSKSYNFHGIILHELGHIMGVEHADDTIMDDYWMRIRLKESDENFRRVVFTKIDYLKELVGALTEKTHLNGFFGGCREQLEDCKVSELYKTLIGRDPPKEAVRAKFVGGNGSGVFIEVSDNIGTTRLSLETTSDEPSFMTETSFGLKGRSFFAYRNYKDQSGHGSRGVNTGMDGSVEYFWLKTPRGEKYFALVERNARTALDVRVLTSKGLATLFRTDYLDMPY